MMHPSYVYIFDSATANEAASAVEKGQFESIIQFHSNKHSNQQMASKPMPTHHQGPPLPPPTSMQGPPPPQPPQNMMGGPPSYPGPPPPPPHHHVSPPNHLQHHSMGPGGPPSMRPPGPASMQQQHHDSNLSPEEERASKLTRLGQLATAHVATQPPPPTMHQMTTLNPTGPRVSGGQGPPSSQQRAPSQQQQQPPLPQQQQRQDQQHMDPLSAMAGMIDSNMDSYITPGTHSTQSGSHTVHHHPPDLGRNN